LFVKTWVGTFTRSFQNSGDGTTSDGCAVLWNYQHSADVTAHLVGDTASPPLRDWYSTTYDSKQVVLRERATTTCGDFTFEVTAKETDPLLSSGGPALFVNTQDGIYSVSFPGFIDAEMTIKSGGEGKSPGQAEWWTNFVTLPLPAVGYQLNGTAKLRARDCRTCVADYDFGIAGIFPAYLDSDIFVTWSIVPAEIEELEVVVDPVGYPKPIPYGEWLPEGNLKNWNEAGRNSGLRCLKSLTNQVCA